MKPKVLAVIPARLSSSRFPQKVLHLYKGRPLLYYVWREVCRARLVDQVIVATDSRLVAKEVRDFSGECFLTGKDHVTGSDRVAETAKSLGGDIIVNVQADNFGLSGAVLDRAITKFKKDRSAEFATLARRIDKDDDLFNPDIVKLMTDKNGWALTFSRFPVPYIRDAKDNKRWRQYRFLEHIGVYLFRRPALARFARWNRTDAERAESLEQLRILENGGRIRVYPTRSRCVSVDSPQDVMKLKQLYD